MYTKGDLSIFKWQYKTRYIYIDIMNGWESLKMSRSTLNKNYLNTLLIFAAIILPYSFLSKLAKVAPRPVSNSSIQVFPSVFYKIQVEDSSSGITEVTQLSMYWVCVCLGVVVWQVDAYDDQWKMDLKSLKHTYWYIPTSNWENRFGQDNHAGTNQIYPITWVNGPHHAVI